MKMIRSLFCAGLAFMALAVCASMPAAAMTALEPGLHQASASPVEYPATRAVATSVDRIAVIPTATEPDAVIVGRSSAANSYSTVASFDLCANFRIDPHLRC